MNTFPLTCSQPDLNPEVPEKTRLPAPAVSALNKIVQTQSPQVNWAFQSRYAAPKVVDYDFLVHGTPESVSEESEERKTALRFYHAYLEAAISILTNAGMNTELIVEFNNQPEFWADETGVHFPKGATCLQTGGYFTNVVVRNLTKPKTTGAPKWLLERMEALRLLPPPSLQEVETSCRAAEETRSKYESNPHGFANGRKKTVV